MPLTLTLRIFWASIGCALTLFAWAFQKSYMTSYMLVASIAYLFLASGVYFRKTKNVHARLMAIGIALDLLIGVILQIQRSAVQTAFSFKLDALQQAHIATSTLAVILYIPIMYLGWQRLQGRLGAQAGFWHRRLGVAAFLARTAGFILMFSMLSHVAQK